MLTYVGPLVACRQPVGRAGNLADACSKGPLVSRSLVSNRLVTLAAVGAMLLSALALVAPSPASATPVSFSTVASSGQIFVTGLAQGVTATLFKDGVDVTASLPFRSWYPGQQTSPILQADTAEAVTGLGHALVIREVPPGSGYSVHVGAEVSPLVTVLDNTPDPTRSTPADTSFYNTALPGCSATPAKNTQCYTYIPTRDGTTLSANITFPTTDMPVGGWPVLVDYSGYDPSTPGSTPSEAAMFPYQGYVVVGLNLRGTTCSGGAFDYFEANQSLDGYDAIEVLAHQPWTAHDVNSKAKIGMVGISYMGISQLFVAQTQPPDLQAITPLSVIADTYRSTLRPGGVFNNGFALSWATERVDAAKPAAHQWVKDRIANGDTRCRDNQLLRLQSVDLINKNNTNPFYLGQGGDEISPRTFVHNITVPTYLGGAWQDEQTGGQFSSMYENFDATLRSQHRVRAYLTNGVHTESLAQQDLTELMGFLDFYVAKRVPQFNPLLSIGIPPVLHGTFGGTQLAMVSMTPNSYTGPKWVGGLEGSCTEVGHPVANPPTPATTAACRYADAVLNYQSQNPVRVVWENGAGTNAVTSPTGQTIVAGTPVGTATSTFSTWPPSQVSALRYYLQPDGRLSTTPPTAPDSEVRGSSRYVYDPSSKRASSFDGGTDQIWTAETQTKPDSDPTGIHWKSLAEGKSLSFSTDAFASNTAMAGQGSVDLWLRSNQADTDLEVTLTEIRPDGQERYIQSGWLRASHRALDTTRSTVFAPFQTQLAADAQPLPSGQFVPMRIGLFPFAHVFRTGSKLRLNIEAPGGNQPFWMFDDCTVTHVVPGCATVAGSGTQINEVAHSVGRPSSVVLPVLPAPDVPTVPVSTPCPGVRNEPCRTYMPAQVPTGVAATVNSIGTAHVTWTAPATGGTPSGYRVTVSPGGQTIDVGGSTTTADVPAIPHGVPVTFTVAALHGVTYSPASDASLSVIDSGTRFTAVTPNRLLDTRAGSGLQAFTTLGHGGTGELLVTGGSTTVPVGAEAVVLNVTATGPTAGGFLTVYPTGDSPPTASNLNFTAGQTVANLVTVKVGAGGSVTFYNLDGATDVVVDVVGFYSGSATAGTYTPLTPGRLLDTRPGADHKGFSTLSTGTTGILTVRGGTTNVPAGATAVVLNVTATGPSAAGFVTVYPTAAPPNTRPLASNLNFTPGQTVANLVTVRIGTGDSVSLYNHTGSTDLVADVVGYFSDGDATGGAFHPLSPSRVLDTRPGSGHQVFAALGTDQHGDLPMAGVSPVPVGAAAVLGNLTATEPTGPGFLTAYPTAVPPNSPPTASNLNFLPGQTVPDLAAVKLGLGGKLSIYNLVGNTQVLFDLAGWYG
jgi:predicted acyl esterase